MRSNPSDIKQTNELETVEPDYFKGFMRAAEIILEKHGAAKAVSLLFEADIDPQVLSSGKPKMQACLDFYKKMRN